MADEEKFRKVFSLLDSSVAGESEAALHQVRRLLAEQTPPRRMGDLLTALDKNVPFEKYQEREGELEKFRAANQELERQNAAYAKAALPPPSRWIVWAARVEAAAIAATVAAVIAAGAHHQAMSAKPAQWQSRLAAMPLAAAEAASKSKLRPPGAHGKKSK